MRFAITILSIPRGVTNTFTLPAPGASDARIATLKLIGKRHFVVLSVKKTQPDNV